MNRKLLPMGEEFGQLDKVAAVIAKALLIKLEAGTELPDGWVIDTSTQTRTTDSYVWLAELHGPNFMLFFKRPQLTNIGLVTASLSQVVYPGYQLKLSNEAVILIAYKDNLALHQATGVGGTAIYCGEPKNPHLNHQLHGIKCPPPRWARPYYHLLDVQLETATWLVRHVLHNVDADKAESWLKERGLALTPEVASTK
ncbi:MAG: hypothetical protein M3Q81_02915 [bacterium]|nr:hypothetical protein [bacterium]